MGGVEFLNGRSESFSLPMMGVRGRFFRLWGGEGLESGAPLMGDLMVVSRSGFPTLGGDGLGSGSAYGRLDGGFFSLEIEGNPWRIEEGLRYLEESFFLLGEKGNPWWIQEVLRYLEGSFLLLGEKGKPCVSWRESLADRGKTWRDRGELFDRGSLAFSWRESLVDWRELCVTWRGAFCSLERKGILGGLGGAWRIESWYLDE